MSLINRYILDAEGNPVLERNLITWALWFEAASEPREDGQSARHVALSVRGEPGHEVRVSTAFLAIDHGLPGRVELFETMVFGGPLDEHCERYATREEAMIGHADMVAQVEAALAEA